MINRVIVTQWNCRSIRNKADCLRQYLASNRAKIIALSETWLDQTRDFKLQGFDILRADRADGYGGVALAISKNTIYERFDLTQFNIGPIEAVCIKLKDEKFYVISAYRPPGKRLTEAKWRHFFQCLPSPFVLCGDLNAYSEQWNNCANPAGRILEKILDDYNLVVMNDGRPTMIPPDGQVANAPDVTICSSVLSAFLEWDVKEDAMGSNHLPIDTTYLKVKSQHNRPEHEVRVKWNTNTADWKKYSRLVDAELAHAGPCNDNQENINSLLTNIMTKASDLTMIRCTPRTFVGKTSASYDPKLKLIRQRRKAATLAYLKNMNRESYRFYQRTEDLCKIEIKERRRETFKAYCENINPNTAASTVWTKIKQMQGGEVKDERKISKEVIQQFHLNITPDESLEPVDITYSEGNKTLSEDITLQELNNTLKAKDDTSPGPDGIQYSHIKNLPTSAKELLLKMYNIILCTGTPPRAWKEQLITPILKPGKPPGDASSYRPIALGSCTAKTYELIIMKRIEWHMEKSSLFGNDQFGFRSNYSTMDNLATFTTEALMAKYKDEVMIAATMDITDAYSNVFLPTLSEKMRDVQIPSKVIRGIISMIDCRMSVITNGGEILTGYRTHKKGLSQGSPIAPLLFAIYIKDFSSILPPIVCSLQYADDLCIWTRKKLLKDAYDVMVSALENVSDYLRRHHLKLSTSKTAIIYFNCKNPRPTFYADNSPLPIVEEFQMLGMTVESNMSWRKHIEKLVVYGKKTLNLLRVLCGTDFGADPRSLLMIYRALIRSKIDYGSFLYSSANKNLLKKIDVVHNAGIRISLGAMNSTPVEALYVEANEPPLEERRKWLAVKFIASRVSGERSVINRILEYKYTTGTNTLLGMTASEMLNHLNLIEHSTISPYHGLPRLGIQYVPNIFIPEEVPHKLVGPRKINIWHEAWISSVAPNHLVVYTDGSKKDLDVGYGVYAEEGQISKKLPAQATVFTAEGVAILRACQLLIQNNAGPSIVATDSRSWLDRLARPPDSKSSELECNIRETIRTSHCFSPIKLAWCPAHCGVHGNEEADQLAKEGAEKGVPDTVKVPYTDILLEERKKILSSWQRRWEAATTGRRLHALKPTVGKVPWFQDKLGMKRRNMVTFTRLRLGHGAFPSHLHRIGIKNSPSCECGEAEGDLDHIIWECPQYGIGRKEMMQELERRGIRQPYNLLHVLARKEDWSEVITNYMRKNDCKI